MANPKTVALKGTGPVVWVANDNGIFAYEQLDDPALSTSRYYRLGIPTRFATKACNEAGKSIASCAGTYDNDNSLDLYGGYPMVRVTSVKVSGGTVQPGSGNWVNKVCGASASGFNPNFGESGQSPLVNHDAAAAGYSMLNCAYDQRTTNPDHLARIQISGIEASLPILNGPVSRGQIVMDTGDLCVVELDAQRTMPCYEWIGGTVSLDPYNSTTQALQLLDVGLFNSFGHPDGFETVPLPKFKLNIAWNENPQLAVGWGVELSYFGAGRPAPAEGEPTFPTAITHPAAISERIMTKGLNYEARPLPPTPTPDDVICLFDDEGTELTDVKILSGMARAKN